MKKFPSKDRGSEGSDTSGIVPQTEDEARDFLEDIRWPDGPACPHCGGTRITRIPGKGTRSGLIQCNQCRRQFTVTVGTPLHRSHLTHLQWLRAIFILLENKDVPARQLQRDLGIKSYRTALRLTRTVRRIIEEWSAAPKAQRAKRSKGDYLAAYKADEARKVFADIHASLSGHSIVDRVDVLRAFREHLDDKHKMILDDAMLGTNTGRDCLPRYRYNEAKKLYKIFKAVLAKVGE